jgi:heme exporter protein A
MWRLKLTDLTHSYGRQSVFAPIHFDADVTRLGISGPNGAGKSTLMSILAGLIEPSQGSITWTEKGLAVSMHELRSKIGFAGPYLGLYTELTVRENLRFICDLHGLDVARIETVAAQLEFDSVLDQRVGACSSGQQQRVRLATSFIHQPAMLFLDEPGTNLDESGLSIVASIVRDWSGPVIIASNQPSELAWCQDTLYVGRET